MTGSSNNKNLSFGNIFFLISNSIVSLVGQNTLSIFLEANFQRIFLKKFNLGYPDILKINLVSNLEKINNINGTNVKR